MPALSFSIFKEKLLSGEKTQTIRAIRKHPIKKGDKLYLFWHQRQKDCEKLGEVICTETFNIQFIVGDKFYLISVLPYFKALSQQEVEYLARRDGFTNAWEMVVWFRSNYRFINDKRFQVIRWPEPQSIRGKHSPEGLGFYSAYPDQLAMNDADLKKETQR